MSHTQLLGFLRSNSLPVASTLAEQLAARFSIRYFGCLARDSATWIKAGSRPVQREKALSDAIQ